MGEGAEESSGSIDTHLIYLNALFCELETMTEEVSAPAIISLQQKPRESFSFELVTAVLRPVLCP